MKKTLVILAMAMISFANAQKGTYLVSGSVGFNSQKVNFSGNHQTQKVFNISPKIGYQFTENWTAGVVTGASFTKNETDSGVGKYNYYGIGAFLRYSKPLSEIFEVYADLESGYSFGDGSYSNNTSVDTRKYNGFGVSITPALLLKIKNGFGLNFSLGGLGYNSGTDKNTFDDGLSSSQKTKSFYFNFGQSFNIGISKNF